MNQSKFLPEWAPVRAVMLTWPYPHGDWQANYGQVETCYWDLLKNISDRLDVWLLYHSSLDVTAFTAQFAERGIKQERIRIFQKNYNDTWIRDYGPLSTSGGYIKFQFNGWGGKYPAERDNQAVIDVFEELGISLESYEFVCEGGALETNGRALLLNSNCVVDDQRNKNFNLELVSQVLSDKLGQEQLHWLHDIGLTGDDTDGHIDTIVRFAGEKNVVMSGRNSEHLDSAILQNLYDQMKDLATQNQWQLWELPSPIYRSLIDSRVLPCTYANFLICNQWVFAPVYGLVEDDLALSVLTAAFPDHTIVPIRCEALLEQHGSLHCATMQIAHLEN